MDAHFELLAGVFIDKCGTVDGVFLYIDRERHRTDDCRIVASGSVDDLLHGLVEDAVLVGADLDTEAVSRIRFLSAWSRCNGRAVCRLGRFGARLACLFDCLFRCHRTRRVCTSSPENARVWPSHTDTCCQSITRATY